MSKLGRIFTALLAFTVCGPAAADSDWGFCFSHFAQDDAERTTALGPLLEQRATDKYYVDSVRPFITHWENETRVAEQYEVLWPLYERWYFGQESNWRAFVIFSGKRFDAAEENGRYRSWFLPIYFQGRNVEGEDYHAVFPLGGNIYEFLGRDKITFALFPIWGKSNVGDQRTTSVLWPIYSRTKGPQDDRHRVFPIYGYSTRKDQWHKQFVLWPIWTHARYTGKREGTSWILFPIYGHGKVGQEETTYVIPPLFRFTRSPKQNVTNCPWPFLQFASGKTEKAYVWPIYGHKESDGNVRRFLLWPLGWYQKTEKGDGVQRRWDLLPVWGADSLTAPDGEKLSRYWKFWPLMSYRRDGDAKRFRMLELWPRKYLGPIERNWQPFVTLFDHQSDADGLEQELLWGLCRNQQSEDSSHFSIFPIYENDRKKDVKSWKLLKGLIGRKRDAVNSQWQFLYFIKTGKDV
ncbi:hypothetical protein ACFLQY_03295 [Verrucomicrobiota bacterium]